MTQATELTPVKRIELALKNDFKSFQTMLSNTHISPERFLRAAVTAMENSEGLDECTPASVIKACKQAAQDGLIIDNREAALVVFNVNTAKRGQPAKWEKQAQYIPMVQGLLKKALDSPEISKITARVVRQNDDFKVKYGLDERIDHEPNFDNPGDLKCAYAIARLSNGSEQFEIMTKDEIMQVALSSKSGADNNGNLKGIWKQWQSEMWRKTVLKRLFKYLPAGNDDLEHVIDYDNDVDPVEMEINPPQAQENPKPSPKKKAPPKKTKAAAAVLGDDSKNDQKEPIEGELMPNEGSENGAQQEEGDII